MRKSTSTAAMTAIVMAGFVPSALLVSVVAARSPMEALCSGALGSEWTGAAGPCRAGAAAVR